MPEEDEELLYSFKNPAFKGELEFDLKIEFLGRSITRKAKVVYEHTPEWEYWDLRKNASNKSWLNSSYHIEIAAVPEESDDDGNDIEGEPYWTRSEDLIHDDILPHSMTDALHDAVDEKCKVEDAERRRIAVAEKAATQRPKSKRRH